MINYINFDETVNRELLTLCRIESKKKNWLGCDECNLKFKCWTHRSLPEPQGLDTREKR